MKNKIAEKTRAARHLRESVRWLNDLGYGQEAIKELVEEDMEEDNHEEPSEENY